MFKQPQIKKYISDQSVILPKWGNHFCKRTALSLLYFLNYTYSYIWPSRKFWATVSSCGMKMDVYSPKIVVLYYLQLLTKQLGNSSLLLTSSQIRQSLIITLGCLDDGTNESSNKSPSIIFFYTFYRLRALKTLFIFVILQKSEKID